MLRFRLQDYFTGFVTRNNVKVCDISGTYMGYIDFDSTRYWDIREQAYIEVSPTDNGRLESDARSRPDLNALAVEEFELAQRMKEELEEAQRRDRKLREFCEKQRNKERSKIIQEIKI